MAPAPRRWTAQQEAVFLAAKRPWHGAWACVLHKNFGLTRRSSVELYHPATRKLPLPGRCAAEVEAAAVAQPEVALVNTLLTADCLLLCFTKLEPRYAARCAAVCRAWRPVSESQALWRRFSLAVPAWWGAPPEKHAAVCAHCDRFFAGDWRAMYWLRPRPRTDGLYVSRNSYLRRGVVELSARVPVHVVVYFRYLAFLPTGGFLSRTSAAKPAAQAALASRRAAAKGAPGTLTGTLEVAGECVHTVVSHGAGAGRSDVHTWLRLRSTRPGANNRLDVRSLVQVDAGGAVPAEPRGDWDAAEDEGGRGWHAAHGMGWADPGVRPHARGLSRYMFVPWDGLATCELNDNDIDFWVVD